MGHQAQVHIASLFLPGHRLHTELLGFSLECADSCWHHFQTSMVLRLGRHAAASTRPGWCKAGCPQLTGVDAAGEPAEGKCLLLTNGVLPRALTAEPEALPEVAGFVCPGTAVVGHNQGYD